MRHRPGTPSVLLCALLYASPGCRNSPESTLSPVSGSTILGSILDSATSRPVVFARVALKGSATTWLSLSDEGGHFVFTGVAPGSYQVTVSREEYTREEIAVPPGEHDTSSLNIRLGRKPEVPVTKPLSRGAFRIRQGQLEEDYNGDGLYRPMVVRGAAFSPTEIGGTNVGSRTLDRCMLYLDSLHANTIRTYSGADPALLSRAADHGIRVIVSFWVDAMFNPGDAADRETLIHDFSTMVNTLKDYPSVLMWNLGNEQNLPSMNGDNPFWYDLVQELAVSAFEIEGAYYHPVCVSNGDFTNIGDPAKRATDSLLTYMDLWASNIYKLNLTPSFGAYRARTGKPVVLTEFGIDALDNRTKMEYESIQAAQDSLNWVQIRAASDVCIGATIFEFTDEWWKAGDPANHDYGGYATPEHPDNYSNEEWWGLIAVTPDANGDGMDDWRPRRAFWTLSLLWQAE